MPGQGSQFARIAAGGLLWLLGLEYFAAEAITLQGAAGYEMAADTISRLGVASCAAFCSPLHALINAGILVSGVTVAGGAALSRPAWPSGPATRIGLALLGIGGIGAATAGIWPLDANPGLHLAGAVLTLGLGNIGMMLMGIGLARTRPILGGIGAGGGLLAVLAFALFAGHADFGLGPGTIERIAAYPKIVWLALVGAALVARASRGGGTLAA